MKILVDAKESVMYVLNHQKAAGRPIPQNDIWIAAAALEHGAAIVTFDRHFRAVPMLTVIVPEEA